MRKNLSLLLTSWCLAFSVWASDLSVEASVSTTALEVGKPFTLTVKAEGESPLPHMELTPLMVDFYLIGDSNMERAFNINGKRTTRVIRTLQLMPKSPQLTEIPPITIGPEQTQPIPVTVNATANNSGANGGAARNQSAGDQSATSKDLMDPDAQMERFGISIAGEISTTELYPGSTATYKMRVESLHGFGNFEIYRPQNQSGLYVELADGPNESIEMVDGQQRRILEAEFTISMDEFGDHLLEGASLYGRIGGERIELTTDDINITALRAPKGHTGPWIATPRLTLSQTWTGTDGDIVVGEPITRVITLKIDDYRSSLMPEIKLAYPDSVSVHEDNPQIVQQFDDATLTLRQVIIPREAGSITLPGLAVSWYNTYSKTTETTQLESLVVNVKADPNASTVPVAVAQPRVEPEVIEVSDPGFWPWLTAIVTVLWLATTGYFVSALRRQRQAQQAAQPAATKAPQTSLSQALAGNNPVEIQKAWNRLDPEVRDATKNELNAYLAAFYSPETGDGAKEKEALQAAIAAIGTRDNHDKSHLAPIVPN
uniref:BatD family protein n=1 Tax=Thaumasiovibrio occultus TaxID=1891184 RepID=UPI000B354073|nr:BatD family protein [Thaumasiovibrio occultus]